MSKNLTAEIVAEFIGTLVLILFGNRVVAMVVLFGTGAAGEVVHGGFANITLGWGLAVMMGVFLAGKISGGHLNPAVTIALAIYRDFPWGKVFPYIVAQVAGGFCGAAPVLSDYLPAFHPPAPPLVSTAGVCTTVPAVSPT